jgi:endonuclease YncB( thermonuclease family)
MLILTFLLGAAFGPCGDPAVESMSWRVLAGTVEAVEPNGELRLVNVGEWKRSTFPRTVRLADVELSPLARPVLRKLVGKRVDVWINPKAVDDAHVIGVVYRGQEDINRTMLVHGLGRFDDPPAYSMSDYVRCEHRIAEREARDGRRGMWAK